jgi:hypothetical protein
MKHTHLFVLCAAFMLAGLQATAQEAVEGDSLVLTGAVSNFHTGKVYSHCLLRLMTDDTTVAEMLTDDDGMFASPLIPAGRYGLHLRIKGIMYHYADLDLHENAFLNVAVDTIRLITLKAITVVAAKHMLGSLQITSRYDRRLWGLTAGYRDANASVAMPFDAHGNSDAGEDGGAGEDGPLGTPLFHPAMPWRVQEALLTGKLGTSLQSGPIWTLVPDKRHPAKDTMAKGN